MESVILNCMTVSVSIRGSTNVIPGTLDQSSRMTLCLNKYYYVIFNYP